MQARGEWRETAKTVPRPYLHAHIEAHDGSWVDCTFLLDSGADDTVLTADVGRQLGLPLSPATKQLGGIGGAVETREVATRLRITGEAGERFQPVGVFAVFVDDTLGECILGYNVLMHFAVILDKPADAVRLIRAPSRYTVHRT